MTASKLQTSKVGYELLQFIRQLNLLYVPNHTNSSDLFLRLPAICESVLFS